MSVARAFVKLSLISGISFCAAFISAIILSRTVTIDQYGQYVYMIALLAIGRDLANFQVYQALVRESRKSEYSIDEKAAFIRGNVILELMSGCVAALALAFVYLLSVSDEVSLSSKLVMVTLISFAIIVQYLNRAVMNGYHAMNMMTHYGLSQLLPSLIFLAIVMFVVTLANDYSLSESSVAIAGKIISVGLGTAILLPALINRSWEFNDHNTTDYVRKLVVFSFFPLLSGWCSVLYYQADRVMLKWLHDNPAEIGILHNGMMLGILVSFFSSTFNKAVYPYISQQYNENGLKSVEPVIGYYNSLFYQVLLPVCIMLHFLSGIIVEIFFGGLYYQSGKIFSIWILFIILNISVGPGLHILFLTHQQRHVTYGIASAVVINVILNYILIPEYGALGAVYATGAGTAVNVLYIRYRLSKTIVDRPFKDMGSRVILVASLLLLFLEGLGFNSLFLGGMAFLLSLIRFPELLKEGKTVLSDAKTGTDDSCVA